MWILIANKSAKFHTKRHNQIKLFQKVLVGATFLKHHVYSVSQEKLDHYN